MIVPRTKARDHQVRPVAHVIFPDPTTDALISLCHRTPRLRYEPRCKVLPTRKDSGAHTDASSLLAAAAAAKTHGGVQEFRQELQAAETKDKKFTKRKTVLKKIVANITMGNDSACCLSRCWPVRPPHGESVLQCHLCSRTLCNVWGRLCWRSRRVCPRILSPLSCAHPNFPPSGLPLSHQLWTVQGRLYPYGHPEFPSGKVSPLAIFNTRRMRTTSRRTATTATRLFEHLPSAPCPIYPYPPSSST